MNDQPDYYVALFSSVNHTLMAEKLLKKEQMPHKVIPVPRHISSDCGVCIRFLKTDKPHIERLLSDRVAIDAICPL